jgi:K+-sensing histidine kinase KdpD
MPWIAPALALVAGMPHVAASLAVVSLIKAVLTLVDERRADHAAKRFERLLPRSTTVKRDGRPVEVRSREVVVGDIALLASGHRICADLFLCESHGLSLDCSVFTGKSTPVEVGDGSAAFAGALVLAGEGAGLVVATGARTRLARTPLSTKVAAPSPDASPTQVDPAQVDQTARAGHEWVYMRPVEAASACLAALAVIAVSTVVAWFVFGQSDLPDVVMVMLLGVVVVSMRFGYAPSLLAAVTAALAFEFFFLPPYFSLAIANLRHVVTFVVMFVVATVISHLAQRARAKAEEARRASLRAETEQLRNALLSSVSHDLRTPLAVVTGATSALLAEQAPKDEESRRVLLETAHREAQRLNRLVFNLLDMARLETGALKIRKELQPLEEVIGAALHSLEDRLRGREVETNIPDDLPLVAFDPVLIEQVFINLLENALKYTPAASPIDISAALHNGEVETEIADRGPGVARPDSERVFEKFYRARDGEGGGVGLGLTICRGIVTAHGGRIWVADRDGGGASFRFTLPVATNANRMQTGT